MERAMDIGPCAATSRPVDLTEAGLVQRVRSGDAAAFRALVRLHQGAVLRLGLSMLKEESLAAELAQEVFLSFWKERARYRHDGRLKAYLLGIARCQHHPDGPDYLEGSDGSCVHKHPKKFQ